LELAEVEKPQSGGADCGYTFPNLRRLKSPWLVQSYTGFAGRLKFRLERALERSSHQPKICLANCYGFVIMRGTYDKNVTFLWNSTAMVGPVDRIYMFDISCG